ncbi:hypothetical protein BCV70DRAFT_12155 [Testicularia cyperi]|uniref:Uncharacterized protein n=1 Tax=Testicularia cyperi TaxID=1882483 RepID=A0A317Y0R2_9BASI|nr:hypothetical protein BCV70DRAFT_12155 [Testicularia cyperi]
MDVEDVSPASGASLGAGGSETQKLLRAALDPHRVSNVQAAQYYRDRLQDRRIQITNLDRARPKTGGDDNQAVLRAERKLTRRKRRVKSDLSQLKRLRIEAGRSACSDGDVDADDHASAPSKSDSSAGKLVKEKQRQLSQVKKCLRSLQSRPKGNVAKKIDRFDHKPLSRSQRKRMGLEDIDQGIHYDLIRPLHTLWCSYIQQLLNIVAMDSKGTLVPNPHFDVKQLSVMSSGNVTAIQASLIKADLCGAEVEVVRSTNPSLVSQRGLVVKETERTLIVAPEPSPNTTQSRKAANGRHVRIIPKHNTVFAILVPVPARAEQPGCKLRFELHGSHMSQNLPSRATRKHKARPTIDF